jgi:hypothetical protein
MKIRLTAPVPFDADKMQENPYDLWYPSESDWARVNSQPVLPSCIAEQEFDTFVGSWNNPEGN